MFAFGVKLTSENGHTKAVVAAKFAVFYVFLYCVEEGSIKNVENITFSSHAPQKEIIVIFVKNDCLGCQTITNCFKKGIFIIITVLLQMEPLL
jgi:hypothetical protein